MALFVEFPIEEQLLKSLDDLKHDDNIRAVIATIENEKIMLKNTIPSTESLCADLEEVRNVIKNDKIEACFIVLRIDEKNFGQVMLVPGTLKPKIRMVYASSSSNLRNNSGLCIPSDTHATDVEDILPSLFNIDEGQRRELMTEKEKTNELLAQLPAVPQPTAMAGVVCPLLPDALKAAEDFHNGDLKGASFLITQKGISVDKEFHLDATTEDIVAGFPNEQPRYLIIKHEEMVFLVYVCPPNIKPRERMPYASSKASFVAQMSGKGVMFDKKIEIDEIKCMEQSISDSMKDIDLSVEETPKAPKLLCKGPKMLI